MFVMTVSDRNLAGENRLVDATACRRVDFKPSGHLMFRQGQQRPYPSEITDQHGGDVQRAIRGETGGGCCQRNRDRNVGIESRPLQINAVKVAFQFQPIVLQVAGQADTDGVNARKILTAQTSHCEFHRRRDLACRFFRRQIHPDLAGKAGLLGDGCQLCQINPREIESQTGGLARMCVVKSNRAVRNGQLSAGFPRFAILQGDPQRLGYRCFQAVIDNVATVNRGSNAGVGHRQISRDIGRQGFSEPAFCRQLVGQGVQAAFCIQPGHRNSAAGNRHATGSQVCGQLRCGEGVIDAGCHRYPVQPDCLRSCGIFQTKAGEIGLDGHSLPASDGGKINPDISGELQRHLGQCGESLTVADIHSQLPGNRRAIAGEFQIPGKFDAGQAELQAIKRKIIRLSADGRGCGQRLPGNITGESDGD